MQSSIAHRSNGPRDQSTSKTTEAQTGPQTGVCEVNENMPAFSHTHSLTHSPCGRDVPPRRPCTATAACPGCCSPSGHPSEEGERGRDSEHARQA